VIAEIKLGSPVALSVVVEPDFFFGSYELLTECKAAAKLPVIAKDFIVDQCQLEMAAQAGADAILLIAALYREEELIDYANQARSLGLVPLIETHSRGDLGKLGSLDWELIGINNRDLTSFEVDLQRSLDLIPQVPCSGIKVTESGIWTPQELLQLSEAGFDAFLVGESLLLAEDPETKLRELVSLVADEPRHSS
jgi:indole-3-glycerol phosphate synthase